MPRSPSEPAKIYWTVGIVISLALHASGVAGAVLLTDRYVAGTTQTEITFSDEASPTAAPVSSEPEVAAVSEAAQPAKQEKLAPASSEAIAKLASEKLQPLQTDTAQTAGQETLAPSVVETVMSPSTETVKPEETEVAAVSETEPVSKPAVEALASVEPSLPVAKTAPSLQTETIAGMSPEAAQPIASPEVWSDRQQETAAVVSDSDALPASPSTERPTVVDPATAAPSGESAEKLVAIEQTSGAPSPSGDVAEKVATLEADQVQTTVAPESLTSDVASAPVASTSDSVVSLQPEALQSAIQPSDGTASPTSTVLARPEVLMPVVGTPGADADTIGVAPVRTEVLQPGVGQPDSLTAQDAVLPGASETVQPVEQEVEIALLVPARPDSSLGTEVDKPTDRYRRIVDFVRQYAGGDCFIALPAMSPDGAVTFQTFGRDKAREEAFKSALLGIDGFQAEVSNGDIAGPQCLALSFARTTKRYPGFSLMIDLDEADIASGTRLSGKVLNTGQRELHLLLVDDEGRVQSLDNVLEPGSTTDRPFGAPLTLTGGPVATKQILIAVATDTPLPALAGPIDQPADTYFMRLEREIKATGADVDLAVEGFNVR